MKLEQNEIYKLLDEFIELKNYKSRKDVLGVFFYGSALYGKNTDDSDLDLHVITKGKTDVHGNIVMKNTHIEYFERPYKKIIKQLQFEISTNQTVVLSMLGYGKILFEKNQVLTKLQQKIRDYYKNYSPKPLICRDEAVYEAFKIYININRLEKLSNSHDLVFHYMFYIVLDKLKKLYEKIAGLSTDISQYKLERFYLKNCQQDNTFKTIPDDQFIKLFFNCVELKNEKELTAAIKKLFIYCTKDLDFNFESSNILLERK